jgi:RNA polymerase sigma-70 factor (ECF subfamily)
MTQAADARTDAFAAARPRLVRLAYRMLGSVAEAEDVAQDAWLRWQGADTRAIADPTGWLVRTATRLCIDRLRAARTQREAYRGPWLPEPLIEDLASDPVERAEEVSVAFLLALERLSPLERAVFLLHEVFDEDYEAIGVTLDRSPAACRQLAVRAREHVRATRPRFSVSQEAASRLVSAFVDAARRSDLTALKGMLAEDAVLITDGGGKRKAALRIMTGPDDMVGLVRGLMWRGHLEPMTAARPVRINGYMGVVIDAEDGPFTVAFEPQSEDLLAAIYVVRNPDKLRHLTG